MPDNDPGSSVDNAETPDSSVGIGEKPTIVPAKPSLMARRAGAPLPKLKNIRRPKAESTEADLGVGNEPDMDFTYGNADSLAQELAELYCYSEMHEFATNADDFSMMCNRISLSKTWSSLTSGQQNQFIVNALEDLELADGHRRLTAARSLLYLLQGTYMDVSERKTEPDAVLSAITLKQAYVNAHQLAENAAFSALCVLLNIEVEQSSLSQGDIMPGSGHPPLSTSPSYDRGSRKSSDFNIDDKGHGKSGRMRRNSATLSDNVELRVVLAAMAQMLELVRRDPDEVEDILINAYTSVNLPAPSDALFTVDQKARFRCNRENVRQELASPQCADQTLSVALFQMISSFCAGTTPHFPMRKVLLLLWKTLLFNLGGWDDLSARKDAQRISAGLPVCEDTLTVASRMKAANPPAVHQLLMAARENIGDPDRPPIRLNMGGHRPAMPQRQLACSGDSDDKLDYEPDPDSTTGNEEEDDEVMVDVDEGEDTKIDASDGVELGVEAKAAGDEENTATTITTATDEDIATTTTTDTPKPDEDDFDIKPAPARVDTPPPFPNNNRRLDNVHCGTLTRQPRTTPAKTLPWTPKIREVDVSAFLDNERSKFLEYNLPDDSTTLIGLPVPIQKSYQTLTKHIYVSMGDLQAKREDIYNKYTFSQREQSVEQTPAELLYRSLLPHIPQYMIGLLKILLSAVPSSKAKTDTFNILCDVVTGDIDSAVLMSLSGSSFSLDTSDTSMAVDQCARLATDIHRHKEVIVKAISSILLLLLKHLRLNHIYQFEHLAQHLVYANCIPLILKFFDHNILQYVQSRNDMPKANYPNCVVYWVKHGHQWPDYTGDLPEFPFKSSSSGTTAGNTNNNMNNNSDQSASRPQSGYFLWRNLYASINLLRVVNKLTKWKHARTMMLVVFKSAPILKRTLRVKQIVLQLYALKLLKMQAKYLGRQWRKSNMEIMSAIYSKVRHRLNDDWAFGNETQSKPWDFQSEETALRTAVEKFNNRRYAHLLAHANAVAQNGAKSGDYSARISASAASRNALLGSGSPSGQSAPNNPDADFEPYDYNLVSVLGQPVILSDRFKLNYETWLKREVYRANIDWDQLITRSDKADDHRKAVVDGGVEPAIITDGIVALTVK